MSGAAFPEGYRNGAFVAFHGSWNRTPVQAGYNVVWIPFEGDEPTGEWTVFADGFAGGRIASSGQGRQPADGGGRRTGRVAVRERLDAGQDLEDLRRMMAWLSVASRRSWTWHPPRPALRGAEVGCRR